MKNFPSFILYYPLNMCTQSLLSSLTLSDPMDLSPLGSSVHGILQARIQEWVAIPFSGDLPDLEIEPRSPALQADSLPSLETENFEYRYSSLSCLKRLLSSVRDA